MNNEPLWHEFLYEHLLGLLPGHVRWYHPDLPYFSGYSSGILFDWDLYFESIILLYAGFPSDYPKNGVRAFLRHQGTDGCTPRSLGPTLGDRRPDRATAKPFLAQTLLLTHQVDGASAWLARDDNWDRLRAYLRYWETLDVRGAGLSVWRDAGHTGMDNHYERAGGHGAPESFCEGVDLNAYLVRETRALALLADALGYADEARTLTAAAQTRAEAIQRWLWDERTGMYFDYHAVEQRPIPVKHAGTFAPLWAGIATAEQAQRLVSEHLLNEREFARPWPIPALAADEPGYVEGYPPPERTGCCSWRAHTWLPTNYYTFQGLRRYGFLSEAQALAERTWEMFQRGRFSEYYTSETGIGTGKKQFLGWTSLALFMPLELELQTDPTDLAVANPAVARTRRWWLEQYR